MASPTRLPPALYRLIGRVGTSRLVSRLHPPAYRLTGGRGVVGRTFGMRSVILTTTGARTGMPRETPLYAVHDGERLVVVGSNAGRAADPAWAANLRANAAARVRVGRRELDVRAREVHGTERDRVWALAAAAFPGYDLYAARTSRTIPVFVLEPLEGS